jgi:tetratricopeptide (TPR) repeat protein
MITLRPCSHGRLAFVLAAFLGSAWTARAEVTAKDEQLVDQVAKRLLSHMDPVPGYDSWPPKFSVKEAPQPNAYAWIDEAQWNSEKKKHPVIVVYKAMITDICENDPDLVALTLGHELGHHFHGHVLRRLRGTGKTTPVTALVFDREEEIQADDFGMKLFLKANYPYKAAIRNLLNWKKNSKYTSFEGLLSTHPSWSDRIALMEKKHKEVWRAMSAFENGVMFLQMEQYPSAAKCFSRILEELPKKFPACYEAHANLGYALLMQYCDALDEKDLRGFGVGQLVIGGFYTDVKSLEKDLGRGQDVPTWKRAVKHMETALKLNPSLHLVKANLGLAYLVKPTAEGGTDAKTALKYMEEAAAGKGADADLSPFYRILVLSNTGVAQLAVGNLKTSAEAFARVKTLEGQFKNQLHPGARALLDSALLYNQAQLALADKERQPEALALLEKYLQTTPTTSSWWPLARERYLDLSRTLGKQPKTEAQLKRRAEATWRLVTGLEIPSRGTISLSDPTDEVRKSLGKPQSEYSIVEGTEYKKLVYPERGVDILATGQVFAIVVRGDKAPPLTLRPTGTASKAQALRVGMTTEELEAILGEAPPDTALDDPAILYRSYKDLGLLVRILRGRVREIAIVRVARQSR